MAWTEDLRGWTDADEWEEALSIDQPDQPPVVTDLQGAARLARRIAHLANDRAEIERTAQAEIARIQSWAEDRSLGIDRARSWLERGLRAYMEASGMLTTSLPAGTARLRPPRPRIEVLDRDAFVAWAEANDRHDLLSKQPSKSAIADADLHAVEAASDDLTKRQMFITDDGEIIPGVERAVGTIHTFTFSPTKETPDGPNDG